MDDAILRDIFCSDPYTSIPDYDPNARKFDSKLFVERTVSETCPLTPPAEALVGTLTQEWEEKEPLDSYSAATKKATIPTVRGVPQLPNTHNVPSYTVSVLD